MYFGLIGFGVMAILFGALVGLVIQILFLLTLMRLLEAVHPQNRAMSPGLVWLNLIPIFNLGWMIYTVIKIKDSVGRENASRWGSSVNEGDTHTIGMVYSILAAAGFVLSFGRYAGRGFSVFSGLVSLAVFILWIIYWVKANRLRRDLERTAGRGFGPAGPTTPGVYYGPGGQPTPPGTAGYGPAGPDYRTGSEPGYGAGSAPGATGQTGATLTAWQAPAPTPAAEEPAAPATAPENGRECSQCGNQVKSGAQFCSACGTPVPKE